MDRAPSPSGNPPACAEIEPLLAWEPTGALTSTERERLAAHVAGCARCAERLRFARELQAAVAQHGHPDPELLVEFAEGTDDLPAGVQTGIREHTAACAACARELELLRAVEAKPGAAAHGTAPARHARPPLRAAWTFLEQTVLRPAPAAVALAAACCVILILAWPTGAPSDGGADAPAAGISPVVLLPDEAGFRHRAGQARAPAVEVRRGGGEVLLLELTELAAPPDPDGTYRIQIAAGDTQAARVDTRILWQQDIRGDAFAENYTLALRLPARSLPAGRHRLQLLAPDGEILFRSTLAVR